MIPRLLALPVEQRAWLLLAAVLILIGLTILLIQVGDGMYQRHRDRVERRDRADWTPQAVTVPMRRLTRADLDDTTGGGQCSS